jgi:hypothetical protein
VAHDEGHGEESRWWRPERDLGGGSRRGPATARPTEAHAVAGTPMEGKSSGGGGEGEDGEGVQIHLSWYVVVAPPRL